MSVDGLRASSRAEANVPGPNFGRYLNVDATPTLVAGGKIRARITLRYRGAPPEGSTPGAEVILDLPVVLEDGKKITLSQTNDPTSERRVTVEVTATIVK
jgi:hypothetical protein